MINRIFGCKISREIFKFAIVGVMNTLIHLFALYLFVEFFNIWYVLASFLAYLIAVSNSFVLNTIWTFKANIRHRPAFRYLKFFLISSIAALFNLLFLIIFTEIIGLWYMMSQVLAIVLTLMINFAGNKLWTYR